MRSSLLPLNPVAFPPHCPLVVWHTSSPGTQVPHVPWPLGPAEGLALLIVALFSFKPPLVSKEDYTALQSSLYLLAWTHSKINKMGRFSTAIHTPVEFYCKYLMISTFRIILLKCGWCHTGLFLHQQMILIAFLNQSSSLQGQLHVTFSKLFSSDVFLSWAMWKNTLNII